MVAWRYEISLRVLKNISRVNAISAWPCNILYVCDTQIKCAYCRVKLILRFNQYSTWFDSKYPLFPSPNQY